MKSYNEQKALEELIQNYNDFGENPFESFVEIASKYRLLDAERIALGAELLKRGF